jgi:hypothetical protein
MLIYCAGTAMNNLGVTYIELGRHADALAMFEEAMDFFHRVLPLFHPEIGEGHVE